MARDTSVREPSTVNSIPPNKFNFRPVAAGIPPAGCSGLEPDPAGRERVNLVRDDGDRAAADRFEQVAVGDDAYALVPWVVTRREMPLNIEIGRQPVLNIHPAASS